MTKFLQEHPPRMGFVGGPMTSPNKSKMEDGGHIEFRKMLIFPYWMKIFAQKLIQRCNTTTRPKLKPEVNRLTSSVGRQEQMWIAIFFSYYTIYLNQSWYTAQKTDNHRGGTCQTHLWKMAAAAILNFENVSISGAEYR